MAFLIFLDGVRHEIDVVRRRPHLVLRIDGREHVVEAPSEEGDGLRHLTIAGRTVEIARAQSASRQILRMEGRTHSVTLLDEGEEAAADGSLSDIRAPMPGAVIGVHAAAGARVAAGEAVLTIESMKLQTVLSAPRDGVLEEIAVGEGDSFDKDQILARLAAQDEAEGAGAHA